MTLLKKIINWLIELFKSFFEKRKKVTKKIKNSMNNAKNKHYLKGYGVFLEDSVNETMPIYLLINNEEKQRLLDKVRLIEEKILEIDNIEKKDILKEIDLMTEKIENSRISFYQDEILDNKLNNILSDKKLDVDTEKRVKELHTDVYEIIDNFDKSIKDKVIKEYGVINYVTISTLLLDETIDELKKIEDNYKHHRFNKYYYDRELEKIKERINKLKNIRDSAEIRKEIESLRKNMYTKSKDKYDLLYNEEIFLNLDKTCDELLYKVNRKVVDIKKITKKDTKEGNNKLEEAKEKDKEQELEWQEKIIKRFQDLELARKLILLNKKNETTFGDTTSLISYINNVYYDFLNGERVIFNYKRNKTKTELVKFYNELGRINATLTKTDFIFLDHINYQLDDLINVSISKKEELEATLEEKFHYLKDKHEESVLVNNKLDILKEKEMERLDTKNKVYVKTKNDIGKDQH